MSSGQKILIVEDDQDLRRVFRTALQLAGFDVREAGDGMRALHSIDADPPDLVVLDLGLPTLDGFSVHAEIAAHAHTRHIPILIVTGSTLALSDLDVACVLRKPIALDDLVNAVLRCLHSGAPGIGT